jgi:NAD(P)-dependent dehydrogenase (short-subunit alcohol dehydrogenase family)
MSKMVAIITGANSGLGLITAIELAKKEYELILLVRNETKAKETVATILKTAPNTSISYEIADLANISSIKQVVSNISNKFTKIDRLINNAGYSPDKIEFTADGYEKSFIANHLGHFGLAVGLLPLLKKSVEARIISVSSAAYKLGKYERFFAKNNAKISLIGAYGDGKLANIFFTKGISKELENTNIRAFSLHPGVVATNFGSNYTGAIAPLIKLFKVFMISPEQGAATSIYLSTTSLENISKESGNHFEKSKPKKVIHKDLTANNIVLFWNKSLELIK